MTQFFTLRRATLCGLATLASFSACATDDADEPVAEQRVCEAIPKDRADHELLEAIDAMGLCGSSAVDLGDAYLVEDDIRIAKSRLTDPDKQARTSTLVTAANIRDVTVRVDAAIPTGGGTDDWRIAVQAAITQWNAVPNNLVRLQLITSGAADITFRSDLGELGDTTAARAEFPANGLPGNDVLVNLDFDGNVSLTESQKLLVAAHEIGHCIGLRHTNWSALGESSGIQIAGTPSTDPASVMNGGTAGNSFAGLSAGDADAIQAIYPELVVLNVEYTGCTSGTPRMAATWGGTLVQPTIEWQFERYTNGVWNQVSLGTGQNWTFLVPTGTSLKTRVRGRSAEGWSFYSIVTKTAPSCSTLPP